MGKRHQETCLKIKQHHHYNNGGQGEREKKEEEEKGKERKKYTQCVKEYIKMLNAWNTLSISQ